MHEIGSPQTTINVPAVHQESPVKCHFHSYSVEVAEHSIEQYHISEVISAGANGTIYKALCRTNPVCKVALKCTSLRESDTATHAAKELMCCELLMKHRHPNIIFYFGTFEHDGFRFFAMERADVSFQELKEIIKEHVDLHIFNEILFQFLEILSFLVKMNIRYNDFSAFNIMYCNYDNKIKLIDFGDADIVEKYEDIHVAANKTALQLSEYQSDIASFKKEVTMGNPRQLFLDCFNDPDFDFKKAENLSNKNEAWSSVVSHIARVYLSKLLTKDSSQIHEVIKNRHLLQPRKGILIRY